MLQTALARFRNDDLLVRFGLLPAGEKDAAKAVRERKSRIAEQAAALARRETGGR
ncbi:hypothetical protein [Methylobacterium sp. B4]|uniref:hypothetical protein n=1 Tax=Methylobacterium sp. B4 TaxID=1938755 RepID=UPI001AECAF4A|nr:hypothetical protein [Methylobacterium sp. B4]